MHRSILLLGVLLILTLQGQAQDCCKRGELFGSYSYFNLSPKTDRLPAELGFNNRIGQHGFGVDLAYNIAKKWALVADFSRHTRDKKIEQITTDTTTRNYLFGGRILAAGDGLTPFAEALIGASTHKAVRGTFATSKTDFALGFGGGVDIEAGRSFAVRILRFDYIPVRGGDDAPGVGRRWSQNFRAQVGILFRFGPYTH